MQFLYFISIFPKRVLSLCVWVFVHMYVYLYVCAPLVYPAPRTSGRGSNPLELESVMTRNHFMWRWGQNLGQLQEHQVLLTADCTSCCCSTGSTHALAVLADACLFLMLSYLKIYLLTKFSKAFACLFLLFEPGSCVAPACLEFTT